MQEGEGRHALFAIEVYSLIRMLCHALTAHSCIGRLLWDRHARVKSLALLVCHALSIADGRHVYAESAVGLR